MIAKRAVLIEDIIKQWFDSSDLREAVEKTIDSRIFSRLDVNFALEHLKTRIERGDLRTWAEMHGELNLGSKKSTILCLHAGNLPLVGFQDMLAVLLSGSNYAGKISKKDPYLIESFLNLLKCLHPELDEQIIYSTNLGDFAGLNADLWMFAGSESSLSEIKSILETSQIVKPGSESILRVAHFSMAILINPVEDSCLMNLVDAILRYDGKGCRSVAIVYSDSSLIDLSSRLEIIGKEWLSKNGLNFNPSALLKLRYSYNSAVGSDQVWVGNALLQVGHPIVGHNQHVYWQSLTELGNQLNQYGSGVQQVYTCMETEFFESELFSEKKDYLGKSQKPELYWKPDGIDPLKWILTR